MIKKYLFKLHQDTIYLYFFEIIGSVFLDINNFSLTGKSYKKYSKMIKFMACREKEYKKLEKDFVLEVIFSLVKARINILSNDVEMAFQSIKYAEKNLSKIDNSSIFFTKLIFSKELLVLELENINLIKKIEEKKLPITKKIEINKEEISNLINSYKDMEVNSEEHLELTKKHLELVVENTLLSTENNDPEFQDLLKKIEILFNKFEFTYQKMINLKFIKIENGEIKLEKGNMYTYIILSKFLSEKIKIKFYLDKNKQELFKDIYTIVSIQMELKNDDPIGFVLNNMLPESIYDISPYKEQISFNEYMKTYILEVYQSHNQVSYKLKQMGNFIAKNKNERLIIQKR